MRVGWGQWHCVQVLPVPSEAPLQLTEGGGAGSGEQNEEGGNDHQVGDSKRCDLTVSSREEWI